MIAWKWIVQRLGQGIWKLSEWWALILASGQSAILPKICRITRQAVAWAQFGGDFHVLKLLLPILILMEAIFRCWRLPTPQGPQKVPPRLKWISRELLNLGGDGNREFYIKDYKPQLMISSIFMHAEFCNRILANVYVKYYNKWCSCYGLFIWLR